MKNNPPSTEFINRKLIELQGLIRQQARKLHRRIDKRLIGMDYCLSRCYQIAWTALKHIPESRWAESPEEAKTIFCRSLWKWSRNPSIEAKLRDLAGLDRIDKSGKKHRSPIVIAFVDPQPSPDRSYDYNNNLLELASFTNPKKSGEPDHDDITPVLNKIADRLESEMTTRLERTQGTPRKHTKANKEALQAVLLVLRGNEPFTRRDFYKKWEQLLGIKKRQRDHRSQCWFMHQIIKRLRELLEEGIENGGRLSKF